MELVGGGVATHVTRQRSLSKAATMNAREEDLAERERGRFLEFQDKMREERVTSVAAAGGGRQWSIRAGPINGLFLSLNN